MRFITHIFIIIFIIWGVGYIYPLLGTLGGILYIILWSLGYFADETTKKINLFRKYAWRGNADAQHDLGAIYIKGIGVEQDYKKAFYWFKKSAEQDNPDAQYYLGVMYQDGDGVKQNTKKAIYWLTLSTLNGHKEAQKELDKIKNI